MNLKIYQNYGQNDNEVISQRLAEKKNHQGLIIAAIHSNNKYRDQL